MIFALANTTSATFCYVAELLQLLIKQGSVLVHLRTNRWHLTVLCKLYQEPTFSMTAMLSRFHDIVAYCLCFSIKYISRCLKKCYYLTRSRHFYQETFRILQPVSKRSSIQKKHFNHDLLNQFCLLRNTSLCHFSVKCRIYFNILPYLSRCQTTLRSTFRSLLPRRPPEGRHVYCKILRIPKTICD